MRLDAIFEWKMTNDEAYAYKVACIYEREFLKIFGKMPNFGGQSYRENSIPKRNNPMDSEIFRQCWKFCRETRGLLTGAEFGPYIHANLMIIKMNKKDFAIAKPSCICGYKAWMRWKLWSRWERDKMNAIAATAPAPSQGTDQKILFALDGTKKFLFDKINNEINEMPTYESFENLIHKKIEDGVFKLWVSTGKISTYYCVLSPIVKPYLRKISDDCSFDPILISQRLTDSVRDHFKEEFKHEFGCILLR